MDSSTSVQETLVSVPPCCPKEKVQNASDKQLIKHQEHMAKWKDNFENIDSEEDFYSKVEQFLAFLVSVIFRSAFAHDTLAPSQDSWCGEPSVTTRGHIWCFCRVN